MIFKDINNQEIKDGDITANRVYQEAVIELVEEFLEEVE